MRCAGELLPRFTRGRTVRATATRLHRLPGPRSGWSPRGRPTFPSRDPVGANPGCRWGAAARRRVPTLRHPVVERRTSAELPALSGIVRILVLVRRLLVGLAFDGRAVAWVARANCESPACGPQGRRRSTSSASWATDVRRPQAHSRRGRRRRGGRSTMTSDRSCSRARSSAASRSPSAARSSSHSAASSRSIAA